MIQSTDSFTTNRVAKNVMILAIETVRENIGTHKLITKLTKRLGPLDPGTESLCAEFTSAIAELNDLRTIIGGIFEGDYPAPETLRTGYDPTEETEDE